MTQEKLVRTEGRFEIGTGEATAYLAYTLDGAGGISFLHTQVPTAQRGRGLATQLASIGFEYAANHHLAVEVVCPVVYHFLSKHPEYRHLVHVPNGYDGGGPEQAPPLGDATTLLQVNQDHEG